MSETPQQPVPGSRYNPYRYNVRTTYTSAGVTDFKTMVTYGTLGVVTATGVLLGVRHLIRQAQLNATERHSAEEGYPPTYARQFKMAFDNDNSFGWGTNEDLVFNTITAIPSKAFYRKVQDAYFTLYKAQLNADLESELSSDEYNRFIRILSGKKEK